MLEITTKLQKYVEKPIVNNTITALIFINAVVLGLETSTNIMTKYGILLKTIDMIILVIFSIELLLKIIAYQAHFLRSGWNIFDFCIVTLAWIPASDSLAVLRALRILRILRLLSVIPQMRRVIMALGHAIPGMSSVIGVLVLVFYISAVLATNLFGNVEDANMRQWFGTIGASAYTLFQIMTLESWSMGIVRPTMELFPHAWLFFVPFIVITSFAVLNLFIGIIVDSMQTAHEKENKQTHLSMVTSQDIGMLNQRLTNLEKDISDIKIILQKPSKNQ